MVSLDEFSYTLPEELIAHTPAEPRETAKLLVYETATDTVTIATVADLPLFIPQTLMIYNDTTVVPARLRGLYRGEPIELLVLVNLGVGDDGAVRVIVNRKGVRVGDVFTISGEECTVVENRERAMLVRFSGGKIRLEALLRESGETPLPPYINSPASETVRRTQYQSIFAQSAPSVAAPTASLHFTHNLLHTLADAGVAHMPVTLQVGLGTFAPVYPENFAKKQLHEEHYFLPVSTAECIASAKEQGTALVAVGTTVVRVLESAKMAITKREGAYGITDLFIFPPYSFTYPDRLLTNFHVPKSSLMCLVQAFLKHKGGRRHITELYNIAIDNHFRFYSFGDAMLIK